LREIAFMIAIEVQHYLSRARDFLEGMNLLKEDLQAFRFSSALLGIHCAISYCDALRIGLGSARLSSDDHGTAATDLKSLLVSRKFERLQGPERLAKLLSKKSRIAYSPDAASENEIKLIHQHAERFAAWAESTGKSLKIEGW
jgi:hypothetical protein